MMPARALFLLGFLSLGAPAASDAPPRARVAVLSIELNDLAAASQPADSGLPARLVLLTTTLRDRLATACGYDVVAVDSLAESAARVAGGYLYAHPDVAAGLAARARADWSVVPRLNRVSPWVADLQAHVVRVRDAALVNNRVVELKGLELTPELGARVAERGAAWMADQVSQAIEVASGSGPDSSRRCPA